MSIIDRIHAHLGAVIRDEWRFTLRRGRLTPDAVAWVRAHWEQVCAEAWPSFWDWQERAAIRQFDGGQSRADAERAAYAEIAAC